MIITHEARLYPTPMQEAILERWLILCSRIYNTALEQRIKSWKESKEQISFYSQCVWLTKLREENREYKDTSVLVLRDALLRLDRSYKSFFRRVKLGEKPGFPRFKSYKRWKSFEILKADKYIRGGKVRIPNLGLIRGRNLNIPDGEQKSIRIILRAGKWYAHITVDNIVPAPNKNVISRAVGIDLGIKYFATLSTSEKIENPRYYRNSEKKISKYHTSINRKKKGSSNRQKAIVRLQRVYERIRCLRHNFIHQLSRRIVNENDLICIEELNVSAMAKEKRFSKQIYDVSWSSFIHALVYKAENAGSQVIEVDSAFTSQNCSNCGRLVKKDINTRIHDCPYCSLVIDRDHNAAINILSRGRWEIACRESPELEALNESGSLF